MLLEVISSLVTGFSHRIGTKIGDIFIQLRPRKIKNIPIPTLADSSIRDEEVWNTITLYGRYKDVWSIYRNDGWLEAIKARDEKAKFDEIASIIETPEVWKVITSKGKYEDVWNIYKTDGWLEAIKARDEKASLEIINQHEHIGENKQSIENTNASFNIKIKELNELDLAVLKNLALYFEEMTEKIRHYSGDHNATPEEADVIANYYLKMSSEIRSVKNLNNLRKLLESIESLKDIVSQYKHESYKYRWSTGLEKEVIKKLNAILNKHL